MPCAGKCENIFLPRVCFVQNVLFFNYIVTRSCPDGAKYFAHPKYFDQKGANVPLDRYRAYSGIRLTLRDAAHTIGCAQRHLHLKVITLPMNEFKQH